MKTYKVIETIYPDRLEREMNEAAKDKYQLHQLVTTMLVTGVHFTAVMAKETCVPLREMNKELFGGSEN
jgi:hypothetical protein